jgi:hypothetical protein
MIEIKGRVERASALCGFACVEIKSSRISVPNGFDRSKIYEMLLLGVPGTNERTEFELG